MSTPHWMPHAPDLSSAHTRQIRDDFRRFAEPGRTEPIEPYVLAQYGIDLATTYAGLPIKNPWGKASGQLSMTATQVAEDAEAGLGFCVLKTLIAQDAAGSSAMAAWAVPASRMVLERVRGESGEAGWTVSWKGRGWAGSFDEYLALVRAAQAIGRHRGMLIVPSCKFHLPAAEETAWRSGEYEHTVTALVAAYAASDPALVMPLEKDFSPTLAGSARAADQARILDWLCTVPRLIRSAAPGRLRLGMKLFNALFDDDFQMAMLEALGGCDRPDVVVYANRLFDPTRIFEGTRGIAAGGPDLSDRNLRVLGRFFERLAAPHADRPELSATGNIDSGRMALEYLLRGARSFQLHTFFQLPPAAYAMRRGSKTAKALHLLYWHPEKGLIAWLLHAARRLGLGTTPIRLTELAGAGRLP